MTIMMEIEICTWCESRNIREHAGMLFSCNWRCDDCGRLFPQPEHQVVPARRCDGCQSLTPTAHMTRLPGPNGSADVLLCDSCAASMAPRAALSH